MTNITIEKVKINDVNVEFVYFTAPMYHEDWHKADEMGLVYIRYNHEGPDVWDDTFLFARKEQEEIVKKYVEDWNRW